MGSCTINNTANNDLYIYAWLQVSAVQLQQ